MSMDQLAPPTGEPAPMDMARLTPLMTAFNTGLKTDMVGSDAESMAAIMTDAVFAGIDMAIEGTPGTGKTDMAMRIGRLLTGSQEDYREVIAKIQATPDLMPSDLRGHSIYIKETSEFVPRRGPLFKPVVIVDEINRMSEKTQGALNERQAEQTITIDGVVYDVDGPSFIIATFNKHERGEATYGTTSALADRYGAHFRTRRATGDELSSASKARHDRKVNGTESSIKRVLTLDELIEARKVVSQLGVNEDVHGYLGRVAEALHNDENLEVIAGGYRATFDTLDLAKARNVRTEKGGQVEQENVRDLLQHTYGHRIRVKSSDEATAISEAIAQAAKRAEKK